MSRFQRERNFRVTGLALMVYLTFITDPLWAKAPMSLFTLVALVLTVLWWLKGERNG